MSHVTGSVQTVSPVAKIGPDFGPATGPSNTWTLNFNPPPSPAPGGTKLLILHFTGAILPAANRLEVDLGYDTDIFTSADGTDFWTRPINIYALGGPVPIRYITNGAATGGVQPRWVIRDGTYFHSSGCNADPSTPVPAGRCRRP